MNEAVGLVLGSNKSPSRKVKEIDNRGWLFCLFFVNIGFVDVIGFVLVLLSKNNIPFSFRNHLLHCHVLGSCYDQKVFIPTFLHSLSLFLSLLPNFLFHRGFEQFGALADKLEENEAQILK